MTLDYFLEIQKFVSAGGATLCLFDFSRFIFTANKNLYKLCTAVISICLFLVLFSNYLDLNGIRFNPSFIDFYFCAAILVIYPAMYLFLVLSVNPDYRISRSLMVLWATPGVALFIGLPVYYYGFEKFDRHPLAYFTESGSIHGLDYVLFVTALISIPYIFFIIKNSRAIFTTRAAKNMDLALVHILYFALIVLILGMAAIAVPLRDLELIRLVPFIAAVATFYRLMFGMAFPDLFEQIGVAIERGSYKQSTLTDLDTQALEQKLTGLMETEKVFTNERLNLAALAEMMDLKRHQLTEYLNVHKNTNFPLFINKHRVHEAARILRTEEKVSVLNIAFQVGFNSKSAFNAAFKRVMDCTPTEYARREGRG